MQRFGDWNRANIILSNGGNNADVVEAVRAPFGDDDPEILEDDGEEIDTDF